MAEGHKKEGAASILLIQAASGLVDHFDGTAGVPKSGDILVGEEKVFKALAKEFKSLLKSS